MSLLDFIFPKSCLGCGQSGTYFCPSCQSKIKKARQVCPVCEKPSPFGQTHPICQSRYGLDGLSSIFVYEGIIKEAVHKLKYRLTTDLMKEFWTMVDRESEGRIEEFRMFKNYLQKEKPIILPIPLYWYKENTRGFNQAALIGNLVAEKYGLKMDEDILKRNKNTVSQTKFMGKERKKNVEGIFSVLSKSYFEHRRETSSAYPLIPNMLLIDDVWTTGSTLKEACTVLKRAGVKKVWGFTIAR